MSDIFDFFNTDSSPIGVLPLDTSIQTMDAACADYYFTTGDDLNLDWLIVLNTDSTNLNSSSTTTPPAPPKPTSGNTTSGPITPGG